jgi:hypothetical protein
MATTVGFLLHDGPLGFVVEGEPSGTNGLIYNLIDPEGQPIVRTRTVNAGWTEAKLGAFLATKFVRWPKATIPEGFMALAWMPDIPNQAAVPTEVILIPPTAEPVIEGEAWQTLVKGIANGQRTALRNAVTAAAATALNDAADDETYVAAVRKRKAAAYLSNIETSKRYDLVLQALAIIGVIMTQPQIDGFRARWLAVAAL